MYLYYKVFSNLSLKCPAVVKSMEMNHMGPRLDGAWSLQKFPFLFKMGDIASLYVLS